ncbi:SCP-like protein [Oesophagostomum dentatum]|uniref:SCP-like protein n=1 Tax=Oesophagostomum dentatum TaxID=61180 RepID=A0A0B1RV35_OESDE|nr:SCP-like protein [Oesophagostomum dentatum]
MAEDQLSRKPLQALATLSNAALIRRKRASAYGCTNSGITDSDRKKFLDYHNEARLRVAKGLEPNRDGGYMNGAKNMYKLQWDCEMENEAQKAIEECPYGISSWPDKGQNIIRQMAYSKMTKLGCAYKVCGNYLTMTCLYNGIAYYINQPMWETGTACTQAADCDTYSGSVCDGGLCSLGGSTPDVTVAPVATTTVVTAAPGTGATCSDNSVMTDAARQAFLDEHNRLR